MICKYAQTAAITATAVAAEIYNFLNNITLKMLYLLFLK